MHHIHRRLLTITFSLWRAADKFSTYASLSPSLCTRFRFFLLLFLSYALVLSLNITRLKNLFPADVHKFGELKAFVMCESGIFFFNMSFTLSEFQLLGKLILHHYSASESKSQTLRSLFSTFPSFKHSREKKYDEKTTQ